MRVKGEACTQPPASCSVQPACTVFQPCKPVLYKGVSGILLEPIRLRFSPSHWSYTTITPSATSLTNQNSQILTNQNSDFETNWTSKIWSLHLHEDGPISVGVGFISLYKSDPFSTREHISLSAEHYASLPNHLRCLAGTGSHLGELERVEQNWAGGTEQSCLAREVPRPRAASQACYSTAMLFHNWAIALLSYFTVLLYLNWAICIE